MILGVVGCEQELSPAGKSLKKVASWLQAALQGKSPETGYEEDVNRVIAEANRLATDSPLRWAFCEGTMGWMSLEQALAVGDELQVPVERFLSAIADQIESLHKTEHAPTGFTIYVEEVLLPALARLQKVFEESSIRRCEMIAKKIERESR